MAAFPLLLGGGLVALLCLWPGSGARVGSGEPLLLYCAAGLPPQVEPVARACERDTGQRTQHQYGGSGTLLSNLPVA